MKNKLIALSLLSFWAYGLPGSYENASLLFNSLSSCPEARIGSQGLDSHASSEKTWRRTKATFYGTGDQKPKPGQTNYDDGKKRTCADGKTVYTSDGEFCAIWTGGSGKVVPLGSVIEVRRGKVTLTLKVTDRQKYRTNRAIDLPTKTWDRLGAKRSTGVVAVTWRVVK